MQVKSMLTSLTVQSEYATTPLNCRIRMPISEEWNKRNLLFKIHHYDKLVDIPNSVTCFPEAFDVLLDLMERRVVGTLNLVNPGGLTHREMLLMLYARPH